MRRQLIPRGFTLIELLVVLVLSGIIAGALGAVLRRQQRFFSAAASLVEQRVSLRDATSILPGELRSLAPGDVLAFSDSALEMRTTIGTAIVCDTVSGGGAIHLAPVRSPANAAWPRLSAFGTAPEPGDVALVFDAGESEGASDDGWAALDVAGATSQPDACAVSPLAGAALADASGIRLRTGGATSIPRTVLPGTFVRVLRRVR